VSVILSSSIKFRHLSCFRTNHIFLVSNLPERRKQLFLQL
jgi:hypothetical protein